MQYQTIDLAIEKDHARRLISERVPGVTARTDGSAVDYKLPSGIRLARLADTTLPNGEQGTRLTYRTTMIAPFASHAKQKARKIREAVDEHRVPS